MGLWEINARWAQTGHPHAICDEGTGLWHGYCPRCEITNEDGHEDQLAAMNEAITHKSQCSAARTG